LPAFCRVAVTAATAPAAVAPTPKPLRPFVKGLGRTLLRSGAFTRYVVIDRWFLRSHNAFADNQS
jgi:hypothetical protein